MKVILLDEIKGKGGEGDIIDVAQGYAENHLLPKKLAVAATPGNLKQLEERRNNIAKREEVRLAAAHEKQAQLDQKLVVIDAKVGDEGVLFGSVTAQIIAVAVAEQLSVELDRKRVELGKPIKLAGVYPVEVSLYRDIKATLTVQVGTQTAHAEADANAEPPAEDAAAAAPAPEGQTDDSVTPAEHESELTASTDTEEEAAE